MTKSAPQTILFAIPSMVLGGSERVMLTLLNHLDPRRFESHVIVLERGSTWLDRVPANIRVHELGVSRARYATKGLIKLCWQILPKAILSTSAHLNSIVVTSRALLPRGIKLLTREGADVTSSLATPSRLRRFIYKNIYRRADTVICQSEYMKEVLIRDFGLSPAKAVRIYNPVDVNLISKMAASEPNPFTDAGPNIVAVGRMSHEKGFDLLLNGFTRIREFCPGATLTLVGNGPDFQKLQHLQQRLGLNSSVRFAGLCRNPYPFIKHSNLLVLPSRSEALPNVLLEAIAMGTPVVSTKCTGALDEISFCTDRMRIAAEITPEAIASETIAALRETSVPGSSSSNTEFEARFGVRTVLQQYERVLTEGDSGMPGEQFCETAA